MKRHYIPVLLSLAALFIAPGCASTQVAPLSGGASVRITENAKIYIATPKNGQYGGKEYANSGATVAEKIKGAFVRHTNDVDIGPGGENMDALLSTSNAKGYAYVVVPVITRWEDRATEWSGIRDKMEMVIKVYAVNSPKPIVISSIVGKSAWATMGGDHPEDLVQVPVQQFVDSLF